MSTPDVLIAKAVSMIGTPYLFGAESETAVDCSGLVYRCFLDVGYISLVGGSRRTAAGYTNYFSNNSAFSRNIGSAQPGDLISYTHDIGGPVTHIGIYVGNGYVISALTTGVARHYYDRISVHFYGVCMVGYTGVRTGDGTSATDPNAPEQGVTAIPDPQAELGFIENRSGSYILPVQRSTITFPTPTEARFEYILSRVYDIGLLIADPYPQDVPLPQPITEVFPVPPTGSGPSGEGSPSEYTPSVGTLYPLYLIRDSMGYPGGSWVYPNPAGYVPDGTTVGGDRQVVSGGIPQVYSSVGLVHGYIANIPWYGTREGLSGAPYGGWIAGESQEVWCALDLPDPDASYEIRFGEVQTGGAAFGWVIHELVEIDGWTPSANDSFLNVTAKPEWLIPDIHTTAISVVDPADGFEDFAVDYTPSAFGIIPFVVYGYAHNFTPNPIVVSGVPEGYTKWLVFSPAWRAGFVQWPSGYVVSATPHGPRLEGQNGSGEFFTFPSTTVTSVPRRVAPLPPQLVSITNNVDFGFDLTYRTQFPYVPGTLHVIYQGQRLIKDTDYFEDDPLNGVFRIVKLVLQDEAGELYVDYQPSSPAYAAGPTADSAGGAGIRDTFAAGCWTRLSSRRTAYVRLGYRVRRHELQHGLLGYGSRSTHAGT